MGDALLVEGSVDGGLDIRWEGSIEDGASIALDDEASLLRRQVLLEVRPLHWGRPFLVLDLGPRVWQGRG